MSEMPERLRRLRGATSRANFAHRIGISPRALANYEQGVRTPNAEAIKKICAQTGVKSEWLIFGRGFPDVDGLCPTYGEVFLHTPAFDLANELAKKREEIHEHLWGVYTEITEWGRRVSQIEKELFDVDEGGRTDLAIEILIGEDMQAFSEKLHQVFRKYPGILPDEDLRLDAISWKDSSGKQPAEIAKLHKAKNPRKKMGEGAEEKTGNPPTVGHFYATSKLQPPEIFHSEDAKFSNVGVFAPALYEKINILHESNATLLRENGDLRVEVERLRHNIERLNRQLAEKLAVPGIVENPTTATSASVARDSSACTEATTTTSGCDTCKL